MFLDPVLDYIEERAEKLVWSFEEFDNITPAQQEAIKELIKTATTETRKKFSNAELRVDDE